MISFRQYLLEGAYQKNLPMFNFLDKLDTKSPSSWYFGDTILSGEVEEWHDGSFQLKSLIREDILEYGKTISKEDAKKYGIKEGEIRPQIENIITYFKNNPKKVSDITHKFEFAFKSCVAIAPYHLLNIAVEKTKDLPSVWKYWFMRFMKYYVLDDLMREEFYKLKSRLFDQGRKIDVHYLPDGELKNIRILLKEASKLKGYFPAPFRNLSPESNAFHDVAGYYSGPGSGMDDGVINRVLTQIKHWLSLNFEPINNYDPTNKGRREIESDMEELEYQWKKETRGSTTIDSDTEVLFPVGDMEWHLVNRKSCSKEGAAMGHCGNTATPSDGDRILSLRTKKDKVQYKPHLTFILRKDNTLGEMKGHGNSKPAEKYHKSIVQLLTYKVNGDWLVSGVYGGGYAAHSNFSLDDLNEEFTNYLKSVRPDLYESESK